jgi:hypothetical protein
MRKLTVLTILCAFLLVPMTALADSISPDTYSTTLAVGESITVHKVVTIDEEPPVTAPVDILFLADSTGSMGSAIANVKSGASTILSTVSGLGDVQFAVADYKDFSDGAAVLHLGTALSNSATAQTAINGWSASGGGDTAEAQLYALSTLAADPGTVNWRAGSTRIVVWFGDYQGHDPSGGATLASTTAALQAANISVEAISVGDNQLDSLGQATALAGATSGHVYSGISTSAVAAAITAAIETSLDTYTTVDLDVSGAPAGVGVEVTDGYSGTYDRSVSRTFEFDVTFTGEEAGDYSFEIPAIVDGGKVAIEGDRIRVTGVPEPGTLLLLSTGILGLVGLGRRKNS